MARASYAGTHIPTAAASVPYGTNQELAQGLFKHGEEGFTAEVTGAAAAGGTFVCPFEPATIELHDVAVPLSQKYIQGAVAPDINLITGAAAAAVVTVTPVDAADRSLGYTVSLPTAIAPDANVVACVCRGHNGEGSL
ncbi:MAG: hypothetical protein O7G84_19390 [Gammaproteobacteria bacterium]|nr:hypothetical protein [Gammaproteobacteria bacterium]